MNLTRYHISVEKKRNPVLYGWLIGCQTRLPRHVTNLFRRGLGTPFTTTELLRRDDLPLISVAPRGVWLQREQQSSTRL